MWNQNQAKHCEIKINKSAAVSMSAKILFLRVRTWAILSQNLRLGKKIFNKVGIAAIATTIMRFASELCNAQTPLSPFWCLWLRPQKLRPLLLQISRCTASGCWSWGIHQQDGSERTIPSCTDQSASSHSKKHKLRSPWCAYPVPAKSVRFEAYLTELNAIEIEKINHFRESISLRKWDLTATILEKNLAF